MEFMKPIKGGHGGCLNCGEQTELLHMDNIIAVGFGYAALTRGGEEVYNEIDGESDANGYGNNMTVLQAEELALKEPDSDWRIHLVAPLSERHYQRQDVGKWVLYEKGMGFA